MQRAGRSLLLGDKAVNTLEEALQGVMDELGLPRDVRPAYTLWRLGRRHRQDP